MRPLSPWWGEGKVRNLNCQILKTRISDCHAQIICLSEFGRETALLMTARVVSCTAKLNRHKANMPQTEVKLPWA